MSTEAVAEHITTDEAIEVLWQRVLAGDYRDIAAAARDLWRTFDFSTDDLHFLALYGLTECAKQRQNVRRRNQTDPTPPAAYGWGAPHPKKWDAYVALHFPYEGADGGQKPLLMFTTDDLAAFALRCEALAAGYKRRRKWASDTAQLCKEHDVGCVADLPPLVLRGVNEAAREAMGRQE